MTHLDMCRQVDRLVKQGLSRTAAWARVNSECNVPRSEVELEASVAPTVAPAPRHWGCAGNGVLRPQPHLPPSVLRCDFCRGLVRTSYSRN